MQKDILVHGRLYVSQNYFCFYANIFRWETFVLIRCRDIASMTKEKTARVIPNAIQVCTNNEKHFFTSFGARDKTYLMLFRIWQNALLEQPMSSQELWQWVHYSYGDELGLTSDDDDYVSPHSVIEDEKSLTNLSDHSIVGMSCKDANGDIILGEKLARKIHLAGDSDIYDSHLDLSCNSPGSLHMGDLPPMENGPLPKSKKSEYPTDLSDTTESDINMDTDILLAASEVLCVCDKHEGKEVLNTVYPISADQMFTLTFTGSKFMADLMDSRKTYDVIQSPWLLDDETGHKSRTLTYTLTLNHSMAKTAQTTDNQKLLKHSKAGQLYMISCEIVNAGIPYSDTFAVKSQYCITRVSSQESRLRVHGCVQYKKSVWGLVKSLIEKTAMQGLQDFCTDLDTALKKESERSQQTSGKKSRRRKRTKGNLDSKIEGSKDVAKAFPAQTTIRKISPSISGLEMGATGPSSDLVIRVILGTLVALLLLNGLLFYKLWSLEDQSLQMAALPTDFEIPLDNQQHSSENLLRLLRQQELLHRTEAEKWKEALTDVIKLLRLMENSLSDLKNNIDSYSSNSAFLKSVTLASTAPKPTGQPTGQTRIEKQ